MTQPTGTTSEISAPIAVTPDQLTANKMVTDNVLMLAMLFAIFYFILIRPQQKRIRIHKDMIGALAKGNRVITSGGLIGTITKFEGDNVVVIEVAQGVKVRIAKSAISEVTDEKISASDSANDN
ncbi:MAG: preprotein translocase subunit YajC [Alphaproteobacteria bacterium]|nr:preprotein translocase subunit YajC [Alphaproteobacteria bacterium]